MTRRRRRFKTDTQWLRVALASTGIGATLMLASRAAWSSDTLLYVGAGLMALGAYLAVAVLVLPLPLPQLLAERRTRAFRQRIGDFLVEGHALSTRHVEDGAGFTELEADYLEWKERTEAWLSQNVGPADSAAFEHAIGNAASIPGSFSAEHSDLRLHLSWQLDVLHALRSREA